MTHSHHLSRSLRPAALAALVGCLALGVSGCNGCNSSGTSATAQNATSAVDPADANMAGTNGQPTAVLAQNAAYAPQQGGEAYPPDQQYQGQPQDQSYYDPGDGQAQNGGEYYYNDPNAYPDLYGDETDVYSTEPPPPLPVYEQPEPPGDDYIWTPGYWAWGPYGYYWVPGAWVEAPYYGALWTPPYWGFYGGRYYFHHGYWGPHVGFYGGIDYGFGYIGFGYFGGYWDNDDFYYNRACNHIPVGYRWGYDRPIVFNNIRYGMHPVLFVSYNGGPRGINVRPRPFEIAAMRERHQGPLAPQLALHREAAGNRAQFFRENHGRPQAFAVGNALRVPGGTRPTPSDVHPGRPGFNGRPGQPNNQPGRGFENRPGQPNNQPGRGFENRPGQPNNQPGRGFENRPGQPNNQPARRFENRPGQPNFARPSQPSPELNRRAPAPEQPRGNQPQSRPAPQFRQPPQQAPQFRGGPVQQHPREFRPAPQPRQEMRPMPQVREAPAPRRAPEARPTPQVREAPQPHGGPPPQAHGGGNGNGGDHGHH